MPLIYNTRDAKGNDITKQVELKSFPIEAASFTCPICRKECEEGCATKKVVSSNFTDWQYLEGHVCQGCSRLFTLFKYSYIIRGEEIKLLNIREMAEEIKRPQKHPFLVIISKSQKKHLFYKATWNHNPNRFAVNLEEETILCDLVELNQYFDFVESMLVLGESKKGLGTGEIKLATYEKVGIEAQRYLEHALKDRQMQIVLHLAQRPKKTEEDAICLLTLILNH